jgi:hypothetical protein
MTLIAKPVIDKQFWILQENNRKVGNIEACDGGYQVKINNQTEHYKTIRMVSQRINATFEAPVKIPKKQVTYDVHGYPAASRVYNGLWNVPQKLPLFTRTPKSKSWYAAGWYKVKKGRNWEVVQDPKLIVLQRYAYHGPFFTSQEATL